MNAPAGGQKERPRTLLLNLPYKVRLVRRYMCSYQSPNILFPPVELLALGGIVRDWKHGAVDLLDAIAESCDLDGVSRRIHEFRPDIVVTFTGFACLDDDAAAIREIKRRHPHVTLVVFGYYPTLFPREFLDQLPIDFVILGEPDLPFSALYDCLAGDRDVATVSGIAHRGADARPIVQGEAQRVRDLDSLPRPAYELLRIDGYAEPFFPRPYAAIQSARGCPFGCTFCVKSYGRQLALRSPEAIVEEIRFLKERFHIRAFRFVDDTFTAVEDRVVKLCRLMIEADLDVQWSCLSRADTLNEEMLGWMSKAGCRRLYVGIESGSQRILDRYNKGTNAADMLRNLLACKKHGMETMGFFTVGMPGETREDFEQTIELAVRAKLDYYGGTELIAYPGTEFYAQLKDQVEFRLFPYTNRFKDREFEARQRRWKKEFYRRFYFRPSVVLKFARRALSHPRDVFGGTAKLSRFLLAAPPQAKRDEMF